MLLLTIFIIMIIISVLIIALTRKNKETKCTKYVYKNTCVDTCGDKYVDEENKICYDNIPEGKLAFEKTIVSSCGDKYRDGNVCLNSCKLSTKGNIIEDDNKTCVQYCDKYLYYTGTGSNIFRCTSNCDYYYINNEDHRFGIHEKLCMPPNINIICNFSDINLTENGRFIFDIVDYSDNTPEDFKYRLYVQSSDEKELFPYVALTRNKTLKKLIPHNSNINIPYYALVYSGGIDILFGNVFQNDTTETIGLTFSAQVEDGTIEDCILYPDNSLIALVKKNNQYYFYHVYNLMDTTIYLAPIFNITYADEIKLTNALKYQDKYTVAYIEKNGQNSYAKYIDYTSGNVSNLSYYIDPEPISSSSSPIIDVKISKNIKAYIKNTDTEQSVNFVSGGFPPVKNEQIVISNLAVASSIDTFYYATILENKITINRVVFDIENIESSTSTFTFEEEFSDKVKVELKTNSVGDKLLIAITDRNPENIIYKQRFYHTSGTMDDSMELIISS